jgi:hypothetical protein
MPVNQLLAVYLPRNHVSLNIESINVLQGSLRPPIEISKVVDGAIRRRMNLFIMKLPTRWSSLLDRMRTEPYQTEQPLHRRDQRGTQCREVNLDLSHISHRRAANRTSLLAPEISQDKDWTQVTPTSTAQSMRPGIEMLNVNPQGIYRKEAKSAPIQPIILQMSQRSEYLLLYARTVPCVRSSPNPRLRYRNIQRTGKVDLCMKQTLPTKPLWRRQ